MRIKLFIAMFFVIIFTTLLINIISAEIMLSQPLNIYNLDDSLELKATIKASKQGSGFFELNLNCGKESKNFYRMPLNLKTGEEKTIETSLLLTKSFAVVGSCNVEALFLEAKSSSQKFIVSDKINVLLSIENLSVEAGEYIVVKGNARKENGKQAEGFLELSVENTDIKIIRAVTSGNFVSNFSFPGNTKSGNYILKVKVYEKSGEEETNAGEAKTTIYVKKTAKKIEIALSKSSYKPDEVIVFSPVIYDQAEEGVEGEVSVKIYNVDGKIIFQRILKSGEKKEFYLESYDKPGDYKIEASSLDLKAEKTFYVEELEKADFKIVNDTLIVTNIGNVVYKKAIEISIGNNIEVIDVEIGIGESKKFKLEAPNGSYEIKVTDGSEILSVESVALTGNIVGVEEIKEGISFAAKYPIVWLFLILVLGLFIFIISKRIIRKKFYAFPAEAKETEEREKIKEGKKESDISAPSDVKKAEHSLVLDGRKEDAGIIAIKIKELNKIERACSETLNNIFRTIAENKGTVYETSDYIIGIFASPTTKTFANEMIAVRISREIEGILKEHNRKFRIKIDYGISLNSGEMIVKKEQDKLRFTSIGNTLNLARKIAELSRQEILLSENMQEKVMNEVKMEKEIRNGENVYHIQSISERDKHKEFIQDFLQRQKAGK